MASISPLRLFGYRKEGDYKSKVLIAIKNIEFHRKELETLKARLSDRRQRLFDMTVRAIQEKDKPKAAVYANEHTELMKVVKVVTTSELALTQVMLRMQSITEIGDAMAHMNQAFKTMREVSKTMQEFAPALENASQNINTTLTETMAQMGQISPTMSIDVTTLNAEELVEEARRYAEEQAQKMKDDLQIMPSKFEQTVENPGSAPVLATGGDEQEEKGFLGVVYSMPREEKVQDEVLKYALSHNGAVDVNKASSTLGIPCDEVEHSMLKLLAEGRVRLMRPGE